MHVEGCMGPRLYKLVRNFAMESQLLLYINNPINVK